MKTQLLRLLLISICLIFSSNASLAEQAKKTTSIYLDDFEFQGLLFDGLRKKFFQVVQIPIPAEATGGTISAEAIIMTARPGCAPCGASGLFEFFSTFNFFGPGESIQNHGEQHSEELSHGEALHLSIMQRVGNRNIVSVLHEGDPTFPTILSWSTTIPANAPYLQLLIGVSRSPVDDEPTASAPPLRLTGVTITY